MDKPFLMHRDTLAFVLNTEAHRAVFGDAGIPITAEQARGLSGPGREGVAREILRAVVAADNAAALASLEAANPALGVPPAPAMAPAPAPAWGGVSPAE